MSRVNKVAQIAASLFFVGLAYFLAPKYLVSSFNSELASSPQKFVELIAVYYGLLSFPIAWITFPSVVAAPKRWRYVAALVFSIFLVSARAATYISTAYVPVAFYYMAVGAVVLQCLRALFQVADIKREAELDAAVLSSQIGAAFAMIAIAVNVELAMLVIKGTPLTFMHVTAWTWAGIGAIIGLYILSARRFVAADLSPRSLYSYMGTIPSSLRRGEPANVIVIVTVEIILLAHVLYAFQAQSPDLLNAAVFWGLGGNPTGIVLATTVFYAVVLAALVALLVVPIWTNLVSRNMSEQDIQRILEIPSVERTPLIVQDFLGALFDGLVRMELFLVVPIAVFEVPRERIFAFPNEYYMLTVTIILSLIGLLIAHRLERNKVLAILSIIAAPTSIVFSTSLDFFHVEFKRRLVRRYATLHQQLPEIVRKLEAAASEDRDRLLIRLLAFYGLTNKEITGGRRLPGLRAEDFDSSRSTLMISFFDRKLRTISRTSLPLDQHTAHLLESCTVGLAPDSRIFRFSGMVLQIKIWRLAKKAGIRNWSRITSYRLNGHYMIFASKKLPTDIREHLRLRKAF